jgi:hypothetical protein
MGDADLTRPAQSKHRRGMVQEKRPGPSILNRESNMIASLLLAAAALFGPGSPPLEPPTAAHPTLDPEPGWKPLGQSLWFDPAGRRLILRARVVLREGPLEHLLCLKGTKEHEAILATDASPRQIHAGLLLTGAEPGHPVRFLPQFEPPTGTPIAIEVQWKDQGKPRQADALSWVRDEKAGKPPAKGWVFAGSELVTDPASKKTFYAADEGDLITVANFASAILDLPFASSASDADRVFTANTPALPPLGTEVFLILRPDTRKPAGKS